MEELGQEPERNGIEQQSPSVSINLGDRARADSLIGVNYGDVHLHQASSARLATVLLTSTGAMPSGEAPLEERWRAGEEGWLGDRRYLLLGDNAGLIREDHGPSGEHIRRQALARQTDPTLEARQAYVWLRRGDRELTRERDLLARSQAATTANANAPSGTRRRNDGRSAAGFPRITYYDAGPGAVTLALSWPTEKNGLPFETLPVRFPPGSLDAWQVSLLRAGIRGFVTVMERLHRLGVVHRNLSPESIIVAGNGQFVLRDLGLAAVAFRPGEGPAGYQAPEQAFGSRLPGPGRATDVYQLAAVTYHLVTGRIPGRNAPPARHPGLPDSVTDIISAALASSPADRPGMRDLRLALIAPKPTR
jgi:hypothetical protein